MDTQGAIGIKATLDISEMQRNVQRYVQNVNMMQNHTDAASMSVAKSFSRMQTAAGAFLSIDMAKRLGTEMVSVYGTFQQLEISFRTMLHSGTKAKGLMEELVNFAALTPFNLTDVGQGAKQLLAYGTAAGKITGELEMLGNVASGVSAPLGDLIYLYGTLRSQGRAYTVDIRQFAGRGIPIYEELAKVLNVSVGEINGLVEAGRVGFPEVEKAFQNMTNKGGTFFNLMKEQSKAVTGQISNLMDNIDTKFNELGQKSDGFITAGIDGANYLVDHYEEIGIALASLIALYGVHKTALIANAAYYGVLKKTENVAVLKAEVEALKVLESTEIKANLTKQGLTAGTKEYVEALKIAIKTEMERLTQVALVANTELDAAKDRLDTANDIKEQALQNVELKKQELAAAYSVGQAEKDAAGMAKIASVEKKIAIESEKQSQVALKVVELEKMKVSEIAMKQDMQYQRWLQASIGKDTTVIDAKITAKNREIAKIAEKITIAKAEEIQHSRSIVANRSEIKAIQNSISTKVIDKAQTALNTAEQQLNTAAVSRNTAAREVSSKRALVDSSVRKANTLETGLNTAGVAANTAAKSVGTRVTGLLTAATVKLNAAIAANAWTLAIAGILAVSYGIYKLITYQTDAEKAQAKLNETIDESTKAIDSERIQIDAMFARMKEAKKGTEEYKAAKDAIMSKYGEYLKGLGDEKTALDDLAKAYKMVTEEAERSARARAMETATKDASDTYAGKKGNARNEVKELLDKKYKGEKDKDGMSLSETYFWKIEPVLEGKAEITKEIQDIVSQFDVKHKAKIDADSGIEIQGEYISNVLQDQITEIYKAKNIFEDTMSKARIQFSENPNDNKKKNGKPEVFYTEGKAIAEIESALTKGQEKLDAFKKALKDNNGLTEDGKVVTDAAIQSQQKYVDSLKKTVLARENDLKIIREVEDRISKLKKDQKETVKGSSEYNDLQVRIDALGKRVPSSKSEKKEKDYSSDIKKNAQEEARIKQDMEFAVRQAQLNIQKDSLSKIMDQNQLNYEQEMEQIKRQKEDKLTKIQEWEKTIWESQGKKGEFKPTTTNLSSKEDKQFNSLEDAAGKKLAVGNQAAIGEMLKQYQTYADKRKDIEEQFQKDIDAMRAANEKAKSEGKPPVFSEENIAQAETNGQDALATLDQEIASREASFTVWVDRIASMGLKQLESALKSARASLDNDGGKLSDNEKAVLRTKIKTLEKQVKVEEAKDASLSSSEKSKKKWNDTLKVMNEVSDTVNNIISDFDGLDDVTKTVLSSATNIAGGIIAMITGIQALSVAGAEAIKGVERASVILAVVGAAISIISSLFSMTSKAEKEHQETLKEVTENKLKMQQEYNLLLMEQNLLMKEATSIFGEDQIAKAARSVEVYRDAINAYKEELIGSAPMRNKQESMAYNIFGVELDSYKKKVENYKTGLGSLLNDVQVKTGSYTTGAWFWKKQHDVMTPVLEVYKDLVDTEGNLNIERAKAILETQTMTDESKSQLQALIDLQEQAEKAKEELRSYLESTFGDLGGSMMDSIVFAIENDGVDAWAKFGEAGASVLEDLGKQIAYQLFFSDKFKTLQKQLESIYGSTKQGETEKQKSERIAKESKDLISDFYQGIGGDMADAQEWMEQWKEEAKKQGLDLWESERSATAKGIESVTQDSVNEMNGRLMATSIILNDILLAVNASTAAQSGVVLSVTDMKNATIAVNENVKIIKENVSVITGHLRNIDNNTSKLNDIQKDMLLARQGIETMVDKGVNML